MKNSTCKKSLFSVIALTLAVSPGATMAMSDVETNEIVISATKTEKTLQEVPATVSVVDGDESTQYGNNSIADMVKDVPGVQVFDVSVAGSKRIKIRGENGGRVTVLIDGQKINEQQSMDGAPLLIDPATVERIEVVKGSGSVLYGSEAIGGVVNVITKKGGDNLVGGTVSGAYNSGTSGYEGSLGLYGSSGAVYYRLTGSYSDQGDRETPHGTLKGSDSLVKSVSGALGFQNDSIDTGLIVEMYDLEADVPPTKVKGRAFDLNLPEWSRDKIGLYTNFTDVCDFVPKVHLDAYYQKTFKDFRQYTEVPMAMMSMGKGRGGHPGGKGKRPAGVRGGHPAGVSKGGHPAGVSKGGHPAGVKKGKGHPAGVSKGGHPAGVSKGRPMGMGKGGPMGMPRMIGMNMHTDNDQRTYALNAQVDMLPGSSHYVIAGFAYSNDSLDAESNMSFTMPFIPSIKSTQEASINTWALYLQDEWSITNDLVFTYGVRGTWVESELEKASDPRLKTGSISDSHPAFSAGLTWNATEDLTYRALFSQGYRFPDLGKLFIGTQHGGATTLPNQDLDPETSNNFELGARFGNGGLETDFALFYNIAENYINRQPFGPGVYRYENVDKAHTYGAEMWVGYRFSDKYNLMPYLNATIMHRQYEDTVRDTSDTYTPLFSGQVGVRFERPMSARPASFWGDFYLRGASESKGYDREDKLETCEGWVTANLTLGVKWGENEEWKASVNFNNIFDKAYTVAENDLEETGMHVIAKLSYSF